MRRHGRGYLRRRPCEDGGKVITPTCKYYLGGRKEFELDKDVIVDFCKFAVMFFKEV